MTVIVSFAVWFFADDIIKLFGLNEAASAFCREHLHTVAFVNVILSCYIPLFGVFQGANHPAAPTLTATCALSVRVIVTYLFRFGEFFGETIIWWNGLFGFGTGFIVTWTYYLSGRWKKNAVIDPESD